MPNNPYNTKQRNFLGYGFQRSSTGDFLWHGRNKNRNNSKISGGDNYSGDGWGVNGGNDTFGFTSYDTEASYFGANQDEWQDNMYDGPTSMEESSRDRSNFNAGGYLNLGLQAADAFIPGASKNPYLQAAKKNPLLKAGMKTGNPFLLLAGVGTTAMMGGKEKKKMDTQNKINKATSTNTTATAESLSNKRAGVDSFYASQRGAASGAYGVGDIDNFTNKYS